MVVFFLTRPGCHLCEEAQPLVAGEVARVGAALETVDIEQDDLLEREYGHRVPVVLGPDDQILAEGIIARRPLRRRLRRLR